MGAERSPSWKQSERALWSSLMTPGTSLTMDGRVQGTSEGYTCYLPPGADVVAGDRIQYNGETYTIMGEPKVWKSPTGQVSNTQLVLERWYG